MCRETHDRLGAKKLARLGGGQILLADVDTRCLGQRREVGTVVDDDRRAERCGGLDNRLA
jgi:hypothetical protein